MTNNFKNLGISQPILRALEEMGFELPTEVQQRAIPHILNREDLIVMSKTGSGKTAVFGVPMLQLNDPHAPGPQGLILTPTRELAVQVDSDIKQMAKHLQHRTTAVYGQHNMETEIHKLNRGISIVTGTPGRVYDHIQHGNLVTKHIRFLVIDEADRMLDMGFIDQVERIIKTLPRERVTLLCSATIPAEVRKICREYMKNPVTIEIESQTKTVDTIDQFYYRMDENEKRKQLNRLLLIERPESCLIFCNTRITVDKVQRFLSRKGYACQALHGDIPQNKRMRTIQRFKQGEFHLLAATDVAARGIHIDNLSLVINYDVPFEKDSYVHRIGRTGRAGNGGRAISFVTGEDIMTLYEIEEHIGAMIPEVELPSEADLNEHRAEAQKWIQVNALKAVPAAPSEPNFKRNQKKRSYNNYQHYGHDRKTGKGVNKLPSDQTKPLNSINKPVPARSAETGSPAPSKTVIVPNQAATTKKPFFKRILQRILGR
jgi:ATP-dependent RNA helicase DeaD